MDLYNYHRRKSSTVEIGDTPMGGNNPIRIQSMTNTSTLDTEKSIAQCISIIDAGADYVRLTAQGRREAENLANIRAGLRQQGYSTPLIADIHFNPQAAEVAACNVEKVRINPGNFTDRAKTFSHHDYTDEEYQRELDRIRQQLIPFLNICKEHHTAIRLGVNHGSLSDRIMSRYGDTPRGMVESCLEYLRICRDEHFDNVVLSIKASNTVIMVETVRMLVEAMDAEDMHYPLHLGVTEAGDGEDGRIKSAVGIGTLLADGIGDTIRVSLSEEPRNEVPVACFLVDYITARTGHRAITAPITAPSEAFIATRKCDIIGANCIPVVIAEKTGTLTPDYLYAGKHMPTTIPAQRTIVDYESYQPMPHVFPLFTATKVDKMQSCKADVCFASISCDEITDEWLNSVTATPSAVIILSSRHINPVGDFRAALARIHAAQCPAPVILHMQYDENQADHLQMKAGADLGALLIDKHGDGIWLQNSGSIPQGNVCDYAFTILQAARRRTSKTEYISCPSCGRTLFDLQQTIKRVKEATSHLKNLKIGIMGCIVNGPGEMADADYGYVGSGPHRIALYKGKQCIERNIPEEEAVSRLIALIKANGDWQDKEIHA